MHVCTSHVNAHACVGVRTCVRACVRVYLIGVEFSE